MSYSCTIERDPLLLSTTPQAISGEYSFEKILCTITDLPCGYLFNGIQPLGCKHCHSCDSW